MNSQDLNSNDNFESSGSEMLVDEEEHKGDNLAHVDEDEPKTS